MIGFLRKDLYMLYGAYRNNFVLIFLLYAVMVLILKNTFLLSVLIWLMAFYGLSAITMDNTCGWDRYARTLPVSSDAIILARFLSTLVMVGIAVLFSIILAVVLCLFLDYGDFAELMATISIITGLALISSGLMLPAAYKWGVEKVRNTFLLVFMLVFLAPVLLKDWLEDIGFVETFIVSAARLSLAQLSIITLGAGLLVFTLGGWLSSIIYAKKEF